MTDPKMTHAMMSFALLGGLLITPRPKTDRSSQQVSQTSNRK